MTNCDEYCNRLQRAGWSIGDIGGAGAWHVFGTHGDHTIAATGRLRARHGGSPWFRLKT